METDTVGMTLDQVNAVVSAAVTSAVAAGIPPASQAPAIRTLNTAFQPSTAHDSIVSYTVQITVTATIVAGQAGVVVLEIASDSGFTSNVQTLGQIGNSQTFSLAVALQGVQAITGTVAGVVPQGMWCRLRTSNTLGTPSYSYICGQEVAY